MENQTTRLSIDVKQGTFSAEGSEEFVLRIWAELKPQLLEAASRTSSPSVAAERPQTDRVTAPKAKARPGKAGSQKLVRLKDLNLLPTSDTPGLPEIYKQAEPKTFYETNAVFVYYLSKLREETVTASHVYTCYEQLGLKTPTAFLQSLRDTSSERKWIDVTDMDDIRTTIAGDNCVRSMLARDKASAE